MSGIDELRSFIIEQLKPLETLLANPAVLAEFIIQLLGSPRSAKEVIVHHLPLHTELGLKNLLVTARLYSFNCCAIAYS